MKILVLDDHYRDISSLLEVYLKGVLFTYTATPADAQQKLEKEKFDVMILDGDLGFAKGPDVLKGWKVRGLALPPVVMFSADAEMRTKGMEAGAVWAIAKETCSREDFLELKKFKAG